jgi:hypothetical protein
LIKGNVALDNLLEALVMFSIPVEEKAPLRYYPLKGAG